MDVAIYGMGYVGTVVAVGLARHGRRIAGVEVSEAKRGAFAAGRLPFGEPGLLDAYHAVRERISISAAPVAAPISLICVGTPRGPRGECDSSAVIACLRQIDSGLVLVRSTLWPGLWDECVAAAPGVRLGAHPEFMREGSALADFEDPALHVVGLDGDAEAVKSLYDFVKTPLVQVDPKTALLLKYASNSFHALKIAFANEISATASRLGAGDVMELFRRDSRLNTSAAYLRPGMPFGGSCLPKDVSQVEAWISSVDDDFPVLSSILAANDAQKDRVVDAMARYSKVAIVGLTFKHGVDDLRGSPPVELARALVERGVRVVGIDGAIERAGLVDANRRLLDELLALDGFELCERFDGDEKAVFFSFDSEETRRLRPRVPRGAGAFALFPPPADLDLRELRP